MQRPDKGIAEKTTGRLSVKEVVLPASFWRWVAVTVIAVALSIPSALFAMDSWVSAKVERESWAAVEEKTVETVKNRAPWVEDRKLIVALITKVENNNEDIQEMKIALAEIKAILNRENK